MSIRRWFNQHLAVWRAPLVTDGHGSERRDWTAMALVDQPFDGALRGRIAQFTTDEQADREETVSLFHLRAPRLTDIVAGDRVLDVAGNRWFTVDGEPNRARDRRREHHVHAVLRRVGGT